MVNYSSLRMSGSCGRRHGDWNRRWNISPWFAISCTWVYGWCAMMHTTCMHLPVLETYICRMYIKGILQTREPIMAWSTHCCQDAYTEFAWALAHLARFLLILIRFDDNCLTWPYLKMIEGSACNVLDLNLMKLVVFVFNLMTSQRTWQRIYKAFALRQAIDSHYALARSGLEVPSLA